MWISSLAEETQLNLRELVRRESKAGGRLRLMENTVCPKEGPLRLIGRDSHGRSIKMVGDEDFLARMILSWPWYRNAVAS